MNMKAVDVSDGLVKEAGCQLSPGEHLRLIREQRGLSKEDIARKLHLRVSVIESIEKNDYSDLSSFVFIRGYLRAYARLLNIAADDIVLAFNQLGLPEPVTELSPISKHSRRQYSTSNRSFRWLSYLIILSLIVLIALGWNSYKSYLSADKEQILVVPQDVIFINRAHNGTADGQSLTTNYQAGSAISDTALNSE